MKKENCPFCGHRWIRKSSESMIECPNCKTEYFIRPKDEEELMEEELIEGEKEELPSSDDFEESTF
jgi:predicted  nucleic acid-binding Zn-ribbon protein